MGIPTPPRGVRTNQLAPRRSSVTFPIGQATPNNLKPAIPGLGLGRTPAIPLLPPIYYITGQTPQPAGNATIPTSPSRSIDATAPNSRNVSQDNLSNGSVNSDARRSAYRATYENSDGDRFTPSNPASAEASPQSISRSQSALPMSQAEETVDRRSKPSLGQKIDDALQRNPELGDFAQKVEDSEDIEAFLEHLTALEKKVEEKADRFFAATSKIPGGRRALRNIAAKIDEPTLRTAIEQRIDNPSGMTGQTARNTKDTTVRTTKKTEPKRRFSMPSIRREPKTKTGDEMEMTARKSSRPVDDEPDLLDSEGSLSLSAEDDSNDEDFVKIAPSSRRSTKQNLPAISDDEL
jgi:hypothetical protein